MGKYALLIVFASVLGLAFAMQQFRETSQDTTEDQADRQETVLARQIARSAFSAGLSEVGQNFDRIDDSTSSGDYEDGVYTTSFSEGTTPDGEQKVTVTAEGTYGDATYYIRGTAVADEVGSLSGVTFDGPFNASETNFSGKGGRGNAPYINGNDAGSGQNRNGVSVSTLEGKSVMEEEFCKRSENVQGVNGNCDIVHNPGIDLEPLHEEVSNLAEDKPTAEEYGLCGGGNSGNSGNSGDGGSSDPVFLKVEGNCRLDNSGGTGLLYVDGGSLTMKGNSSWKGLILVSSGGSFTTSRGTPRVEGNVSFYTGESSEEEDGEGEEDGGESSNETGDNEGGSLDMRGTADIQYNSDRLREVREAFGITALQELLNTPPRKEVRLSDRCDGIAGPDGNLPESCRR